MDRATCGGVHVSPERSYGGDAVERGAIGTGRERPSERDYSICVDLEGWEEEETYRERRNCTHNMMAIVCKGRALITVFIGT